VAAELEDILRVPTTLIPGRGGVFQIRIDGRVVYCKAETGRFPKPGEAADRVRGRGISSEI